MKNKLTLYFILIYILLFVNFLSSGAVIPKFEGRDGGNKVILIWQSIVEVSLDHYEIERKLENQTDFIKIGTVNANGPKTYEFIDKSVFKQNSHTFNYRLKLVDKDGSSSTYGKVITVKPNISGIKHTWGSLKAMFR